jgi:UDP-glucuronate 4-epimerase
MLQTKFIAAICLGKTNIVTINRKILVTGSAGFIGSALTLRLLARGDTVVGIDNHNNYYAPGLKEARLARYAKHPN